MSSHSRTSSKIEEAQYCEILPVYFDAFLKDFSFGDVKDKIKDLFTNDEYDTINNEKNEEFQLRQLFWTLCQNDEIIPKFLDAISSEYPWLVAEVKKEYPLVQHEKTQRYIKALRTLRREDHKHTDTNVHRIEPYQKLHQALKKLTTDRFVVLSGELGMGKKWLTVDIRSDYEIQCAMNFKIYSIDVGQCISQEDDLRVLQELRLKVDDTNMEIPPAAGTGLVNVESKSQNSNDIKNRILELQLYLINKLRQEPYKNALIILKDVQNVKTWKAFNFGRKLLLITRNKTVSKSLSPTITTHIDINEGLTHSEYYCLFRRYLGRNYKFPEESIDIYYQSNRHPYLLSIIAENLRQKKEHIIAKKNNWDEWITQLQSLSIHDNKFATVIELSLNVLRLDEERNQISLLEFYATLAIFQHSILIPVKLLAALWDKSKQETERIISKFHKYSIASKEELPDGSTVCTVPFIYSSHIKNSPKMQKMINRQELHHKVIAHYNLPGGLCIAPNSYNGCFFAVDCVSK